MAVATPALARAVRRPGRAAAAGAVVLGWVVLWLLFRGTATLPLDDGVLTPFHERLNAARDWVDANRNTSPLFLYGFNEIRVTLDGLTNVLREFIAVPAPGNPIPTLGWLGVVAVAGWVAWAAARFRIAVLVVVGLVVTGLQGLWTETMDTLALTLAAVLVALLIGIPLGVLAGTNPRVQRAVTPVLDFMQTMPSMVYLAPLTLLFLIGPASSVIVTLIFAMPPAVRLTAHGIRTVAPDTVEAAQAMGSTRLQSLVKVLLPMARSTIVLGINQTIMAALSMVTIAALIDAPGLGKVVLSALQTQDVGRAFNAGVALVVLAIVLDRSTTAAAARAGATPSAAGSPGGPFGRLAVPARYRRPVLGAGLALVAFLVYESREYEWAAFFPKTPTVGGVRLDLGTWIANGADSATSWAKDTLPVLTQQLKDLTTSLVINPLQSLFADSPFWATGTALVLLAAVVGGLRAAVTAGVCLALVVATGLWQDAMVTLSSTIVATVLVVLVGVLLGVWMGRSRRADQVIRPVLDAAQVMPAFVYLVPFLALFEASRFTAITAAMVYAVPVAAKVVADGIRDVSASTVEAATAAGSSAWQIIGKVQLPMAAPALTLAVNQGLIYVLSMVVVGGLAGGGALGFDVITGFSQSDQFGRGLAAGLAIVLLGILLDRTTQAAATRMGRSPATRTH